MYKNTRIKITNFRGIAEAEAELKAPITLLAGDNGNGKTSFAQAVALALCGETPIDNAKKGDLKFFIKEGASASEVALLSEAGEFKYDIVTGKPYSIGKIIKSSVYGCGIKSPCDMGERAASDFWIETLGALPSKEELSNAFQKDLEINIENLWAEIQTIGWDGVYKSLKEKGARFKGGWQQVTGQEYGSKKAETWLPEKWEDDLYAKTLEQLDAEIKEFEEAHKKAIQKDATLDADIKRLSGLAAKCPALFKEVETLKKSLGEIPQSNMTCPHCGKDVILVGTRLAIGKPVSKTALEEYKINKKALDEKQAELHAAQKASEDLQDLKKKSAAQKASEDTPAEEIARILAALEKACARRAAKEQYIEAKSLHEKVARTSSLVKVLAPEGLRASKLQTVLEGLNSQLNLLSSEAGWEKAELLADMSVRYGGRPFKVLSESEQYRTRAIFQLSIAQRLKDDLVIFDRADLLTSSNRNGLIAACLYIAVPALICLSCAANKKEIAALPDLESLGYGLSYFVEKGVIYTLAEAKEKHDKE